MVNRKLCRGCCHWRRHVSGGAMAHCGYLMDTGRCRTPQMTPEQIRTGECPFFDVGPRRNTQVKAFIVSPDPLSRLAYGLPRTLKPRRPKVDEDKLLTLYDQGKTDGEIAEALGCAKDTVRLWRKRKELPPNVDRPKPRIDYGRVRELYMEGLSDRRIGEILGCCRSSVSRWRLDEGLPLNKEKEAVTK